jgi:cell division protein FtsB
MKQFFKKYINNKYFYTGLAFVVWMVFFDSDNLMEQMKLNHKINHLEQKKEFYQKEISKNQNAIKALTYDTAQLEKFAREKYFMKKDNEDVFVIIRSKHE